MEPAGWGATCSKQPCSTSWLKCLISMKSSSGPRSSLVLQGGWDLRRLLPWSAVLVCRDLRDLRVEEFRRRWYSYIPSNKAARSPSVSPTYMYPNRRHIRCSSSHSSCMVPVQRPPKGNCTCPLHSSNLNVREYFKKKILDVLFIFFFFFDLLRNSS